MTLAELLDANEAMRRHAGGDASAFNTVYRVLAGPLRRYVNARVRGDSALVDDIVQNTFVRMHLARSRFDDGGQVLPWALTIARNLVVDAKRAGKRGITEEIDMNTPDVRTGDLSHVAGAKEDAHSLIQALAELSVEQREAVWLMRVEGLTAPEAALVVGVDATALRARLHRATTNLRSWAQSRGIEHADQPTGEAP